jgi:predicted nuclease of predicted toxin-antitoxin system
LVNRSKPGLKFLADECCSADLVKSLRDNGYDVFYVKEEMPGATDEEVLLSAINNNRILITEDTDFGELIFRLKKTAYGVILIRINVKERHLKCDRLLKLISNFPDRIKGYFIIVDSKKYRFRLIMP